MAPTQPQAKKTMRTKHLDVVRNGNDDYTATELELESADGGKTWRTSSTRTVAAKKSRNVVTDYVREWWQSRVGRNGTGDFE